MPVFADATVVAGHLDEATGLISTRWGLLGAAGLHAALAAAGVPDDRPVVLLFRRRAGRAGRAGRARAHGHEGGRAASLLRVYSALRTGRDLLGTRLELRLGDPVDSVVNMMAAATVPRVPGRGITEDHLHFLAALPRLSGLAGANPADPADGVAETVEAISDAWYGPRVPAVRMLPAVLDVAELPAPEGRLRVPIGLDGQTMGVQWHDFEETPHLIIAGDTESGKTNLLKLLVKAVVGTYTPAEARIMGVDVRRGCTTPFPPRTSSATASRRVPCAR